MLKSSLVFVFALAAGATALAGDVAPAAKSTNRATAAGTSAAGMASPDSAFMMKAGGDGLAEVELGKLAVEHASSAGVKAFAQMMVDDHSKANGELSGLAGQKGVTLPAEPPPPAKAAKAHLASLSGAAFDKAYTDHMVKDHEKARRRKSGRPRPFPPSSSTWPRRASWRAARGWPTPTQTDVLTTRVF
jgi:putative membrane protein